MTYRSIPQYGAIISRVCRAMCVFGRGIPLVVLGCGRNDPASTLSEPNVPARDAPYFEDVTQAKGLPNKQPHWPDGTFATPEVTAGGVALFDYDNDGRLDILQVCH